MWSLNFFILIVYLLFVFLVLIYLISNLKSFIAYDAFKNSVNFTYLSGLNLLLLLLTPTLLLILLNFTWSGFEVNAWFGNLIWSSFQYKINYLIIVSFSFIWSAYLISFYYTSSELYDYTSTTYSFFLWTAFLFLTNNIITLIFFIEILSTLIMLMIITSTFSSAYFYNNVNISRHNYFTQTMPTSFLSTILFFFWISLVSSLTLFVFTILFYLQFFTFDWFSTELILFYVLTITDLKGVFMLSLTWLFLMFCIFLKCGLVPFYIWKPIFFKGIPLHALFFYIVFFYFFIFYFFIYFFVFYLNELFYLNVFINLTLLMLGLVVILFIICESFYLKAFLAMSSILNTLLVFLALNSYSLIDTLFIL